MGNFINIILLFAFILIFVSVVQIIVDRQINAAEEKYQVKLEELEKRLKEIEETANFKQ